MRTSRTKLRWRRFVLLVGAVAVAGALGLACANAPTSPSAAQRENAASGGPDTSQVGIPPAVHVTGRILGVDASTASQGSTDTLHFEPLAGATITVLHNVLVDGVAAQIQVAQLESGPSGAYELNDLPGGYYIVEAAPPPNSPYGSGWSYLPALEPDVAVDVYLWRP